MEVRRNLIPELLDRIESFLCTTTQSQHSLSRKTRLESGRSSARLTSSIKSPTLDHLHPGEPSVSRRHICDRASAFEVTDESKISPPKVRGCWTGSRSGRHHVRAESSPAAKKAAAAEALTLLHLKYKGTAIETYA